MPAPDLASLFAIADAIHPRLKARLTPILATFTPRETADLPSSRIDATFTQGAWMRNKWGVDRSGVMHHNAWDYRIELEISTARVEQAGVPQPDAFYLDAHSRLRARVHAAMIAAAADPAFLPWHCLASCDEAGFDATAVTTDNADISKLAFSGIVAIRSDAWPL